MAEQQSMLTALEQQLAILRRTRAEFLAAGLALPDALQAQIVELESQLAAAGAESSPAGGDVAWRDKHILGDDVAGDKVAGHKILATLRDGSRLVGGDAYGLVVFTRGDVQVSMAPGDVSPETLLAAYYRSLAGEACRLPLGVIDVEFVRTSGEHSPPLPEVYVDLDVVAPAPEKDTEGERGWALRLARGESRDRMPLLEALSRPESRLTVLLGDAGSGKSTFVNYVTYQAASGKSGLPEDWRSPLVARFVLREVAARHIPAQARRGQAQMLWDALQEDMAGCLGQAGAERLLAHLQARLWQEGGLILLDGLDEVPAAGQRRKVLIQAARDLVDSLPQKTSRVLVTARPYAYADKACRLPDFATLALAPFSDAQVRRFVERWYQAVRPSMQWSEETARGKGQGLQQALDDRPYLADLASRPLLLTLMATLHSSWGTLPEDRAELYEETVKLLLGRWQRAREVRGPGGELVVEPGIGEALAVGEDRIRSALQALAYGVHRRQRADQDGKEGPADITEGEVLVAFKPLLGKVEPDTLLAYLQERAGLLVSRREGVYAFPHRSFQEYLAACHIADQPDYAQQLSQLARQDPLWWREVVLLGVGKAKRGGLGAAVSLVGTLLPALEEVDTIGDICWRVATLAGLALLELRLVEQAQGEQPYKAILRRVGRWLVRLLEGGHLPALERLEAGNTLGWIGDSRFVPKIGYLPEEDMLGFVEIPEGPFRSGFAQEQILPCYYIGRFPVTVAQWRAFVDQHQQSSTFPRFGSEPGNNPVNGVTLKQAAEYCAWLTKCLKETWSETPETLRSLLLQGDWRITLPTEQQWEKAARDGKDWIFPWGNEPDPSRANYRDTGIGRAVAVGSFPGGVSPYGVHDMAGNVTEWTRSSWSDEAPLNPDRLEGQSGDSVALRSGGPNSPGAAVRCDARHHAYASYGLDGFGFRIVLTRV